MSIGYGHTIQNDMKIEKLKLSDIPALLNLYLELDSIDNSQDTAEKIYKKMIGNGNYIVLVAKIKGDIVGTAVGICCHTLALGGKNFLIVEDVVVKRSFRSRGIGKKLLQALDSFAVENNCATAMLTSSLFRKEAHKFYEKIGYNDSVKSFRKIYNDTLGY